MRKKLKVIRNTESNFPMNGVGLHFVNKPRLRCLQKDRCYRGDVVSEDDF